MKPKSLILLGVSGLFGLVAAALFTSALGQPGAAVPMKDVVIAVEDIEINALLTDQNCKIEQWPANIVPEGIVESFEQIAEKRVNVRLTRGTPLFQRDLLNKYGNSMIHVPENKKLVGLKVPSEDHIAGLLQPGHTVDVIGIFQHEGRSYSNTFLRGIKVFSVSNKVALENEAGSKSNENDTTVGLIVSERQSEMLTLVKQVATVKLAIRGVDDKEGFESAAHEKEGTLTLQDLMGLPPKSNLVERNPVKLVETKKDEGHRMQFFRGDFYYEYIIEEGKMPRLVTAPASEDEPDDLLVEKP